jgi:uncharacterized protein involved in exopolysaccharide biosynthesis
MREADPLFPMNEAGQSLTVHDLLREWFKYWRTVVLCTLVVSLLAWGALVLLPPTYESSAKIWVQTEQQGTPSFLSGVAAYRESQDPEPVDRKIETEIQLLMSRSNAEAVVDQLGITKAQLVQAPFDLLKSLLPHRASADSADVRRRIRNDTVALFMKAVTVEPLRSKTADTTSNVFEARFDCVDKNLAPRALKALVDEYFRFGANHTRELGESAYRLVDAKTREEMQGLRDLDDQILTLTVQSASRPDVAMPGSDTGQSLDTTLSSGRTGAPSGLGLLKSEIIELQAKLEEARQLYTDDSPEVRHLMEQLADLRGRLNVGVQASAELDERLERLERQRALALERFKELQTKRDQIELYLQLNVVISDTRVLTEAPLQPDKAKTKTKIVVAGLAPLAGFFLGLLLAGIREYFDHRLQDPSAVDRYLGLETLAIVPKGAS